MVEETLRTFLTYAFAMGILGITINFMVLCVALHLWMMHLRPERYGFGTGLKPGDLEEIKEVVREEIHAEWLVNRPDDISEDE